MRSPRIAALLCALLLLGAVVAPAQAQVRPTGVITVSAASSLTDVMPVIARAFEKRFPGTSVKLNFGGSSTLVNQVLAGAPVDVLATASEETMGKAVDADAVGRPLLFAKNTMTIAVPADNPGRIRSLADLARPGVLVGMCEASVPCGAVATEILKKAHVSVTPVTKELEVRGVLAKVLSGDLDAGIVYTTDAKAAGSKVAHIDIPSRLNATTTYPIATVGATANPVAAQTFVDYVRFSSSAQGILRAYGFARPW